jgi:MoaA/NifB/PqqE/SkfB family radical SAM enzyme
MSNVHAPAERRRGMNAPSLATAVLVRLGEVTNRTLVLPLVIFYPTSRCNSRCVSCDWWKQSGAGDLMLEEIDDIAGALPGLGTRVVVFSGGEPLLRPEVFDAAAMFRARGLTLHLLTSGILLERFADRVAQHFSRVCISLDATTEALYEQVRGVAALGTVARGVERLRIMAPHVPLTARSTLHRANFRELPRLIEYARALGLDGISFLPADVSSHAFGRERTPDGAAMVLDADDVEAFAETIERTIAVYRDDFETGFVAESPDKLRRLPRYYAALSGGAPFPAVSCNAPYVSVVIEANGDVRPCFFHDAIGNVRAQPLASIVTDNLRQFRHQLDVEANGTCRRCVCSLKTGWRRAPWLS